jgi:hypothetical protein
MLHTIRLLLKSKTSAVLPVPLLPKSPLVPGNGYIVRKGSNDQGNDVGNYDVNNISQSPTRMISIVGLARMDLQFLAEVEVPEVRMVRNKVQLLLRSKDDPVPPTN